MSSSKESPLSEFKNPQDLPLLCPYAPHQRVGLIPVLMDSSSLGLDLSFFLKTPSGSPGLPQLPASHPFSNHRDPDAPLYDGTPAPEGLPLLRLGTY